MPVTVQSLSDTLFLPSITTASLLFAVSVASDTDISAVEYIAGLPVPFVT